MSNVPAAAKRFCRSVLRIEVPVVVTLARKPLAIDQILNLVPGTMIQFEKALDSPMTVEVGEQPIAEGEVVKSGDKFGIRISNIFNPPERFIALLSGQTGMGSAPATGAAERAAAAQDSTPR